VTDSSVGAVKEYDTELLRELAAEFNLTYDAFGVHVSEKGAPARGTLTLSDAWNAALEPAPVTPTGPDAGAFQVLSGTIKASYNAHMRGLKGKEIYVSPAIMSGNTGRVSPHSLLHQLTGHHQ
jgi:Gly-Xaa carboxypeptidase